MFLSASLREDVSNLQMLLRKDLENLKSRVMSEISSCSDFQWDIDDELEAVMEGLSAGGVM